MERARCLLLTLLYPVELPPAIMKSDLSWSHFHGPLSSWAYSHWTVRVDGGNVSGGCRLLGWRGTLRLPFILRTSAEQGVPDCSCVFCSSCCGKTTYFTCRKPVLRFSTELCKEDKVLLPVCVLEHTVIWLWGHAPLAIKKSQGWLFMLKFWHCFTHWRGIRKGFSLFLSFFCSQVLMAGEKCLCQWQGCSKGRASQIWDSSKAWDGGAFLALQSPVQPWLELYSSDPAAPLLSEGKPTR